MLPVVPLLLLFPACDPAADDSAGRHPGGDTAEPAPTAPSGQDLIATALTLDLAARAGAASLEVELADGADAVRLESGDLRIESVTLDGGRAQWDQEGARLRIPASPGVHTVVVNYTFLAHRDFDGWNPDGGYTFVWPYFCGNLFPCVSDPADGLTFTMDVSGTGGFTAVYPAEIPTDAPAYMPGVTVGLYTEARLGVTSAGTELYSYTLPGGAADGAAGTANLVAAFDYFESTYGPYRFGDRAGSVAVSWGGDAYGGMEHHPYWHVAAAHSRSEEVHVHEAGHGWFGDGVRIACWEDFTLSEGTTTYIAARALEQVGGPNLFPTYVEELDYVCDTSANTIAMPDTCGEIDILVDPLWSMVPYMKGACFYEDVADTIGADLLDTVIAEFYAEHGGEAATMEEMIAAIERAAPEHEAAVDQLVADWLTTRACPTDYAARCGAHQ